MELQKQLMKADDTDRQLDLLNALSKMDMTCDILVETKVGTVVKPLKKSEDATLAAAAKELMKAWKAVYNAAAGASEKQPPPPPRPQKAVEESAKSASSSSSSLSAAKPPPSDDRGPTQPAADSYKYELAEVRTVFREKLREKLMMEYTGTVPLFGVAETLEAEINKWAMTQKGNTQKEYQNKCRALVANLRKNGELRRDYREGKISAHDLVRLSPEALATKGVNEERERLRQAQADASAMDYHKRQSVIEQKEKVFGIEKRVKMFKCWKCGSDRVQWWEKQTRAADEPMTQFYRCLMCDNEWRG